MSVHPGRDLTSIVPVAFSSVPPGPEERCAGDLHLPLEGEGPWPVVVMAHGIGAERSFGLAAFARRFAARGIAALVFDYRHFGESGGETRFLVSPSRQRADYRAALAFVRGDSRLDGTRIALRGTSFSGGHVLRLAAEGDPAVEEGLRGVVFQIPFTSGLASTLASPLHLQLPAVILALVDLGRGLLRLPPFRVPVARGVGGAIRRGADGWSFLASPDSSAGYASLIPPPARAMGWSRGGILHRGFRRGG